MNSIFIVNLFSSFFLCGLIWTIQIVHYPYFIFTDSEQHQQAMNFHRARISFIVVPAMLTELLSSAWLTFTATEFIWLHTAGFIIVLLIWVITFAKQVPLHSNLANQFSRTDINNLVKSNRWRTILWTLKSVIGILILKEYLI